MTCRIVVATLVIVTMAAVTMMGACTTAAFDELIAGQKWCY